MALTGNETGRQVQTRAGLVLRNMPDEDVARLALQAEASGFTDVFFPETGHVGGMPTGRDPFLAAAAALRVTSDLRAGPGVSITLVRTARAMALAAATVQEDSGGRFALACGVSHRAAMEQLNVAYPASVLDHVKAYLSELRDLSRDGMSFGKGFPIMLGALGPRMLRVAATASDGALLNWLTPEWASRISSQFAARAQAAGNARPEIALYIRVGKQEALLSEAGQYRGHFPNYARHFDRQALDSLDLIVRSTCTDLHPKSIVDTMENYRQAGITLPCLYPVGMTSEEIRSLLASISAAL